MGWYNSQQTKNERELLINVLLQDKRLNRKDKTDLRDILRNDSEGHFHVDKYGNVRPSLAIPKKEIVEVRSEVVAPKHVIQGTLFDMPVEQDGSVRVKYEGGKIEHGEYISKPPDRKIKKVPKTKQHPGLSREELAEKDRAETYLKALRFKMTHTGHPSADRSLDKRNADVKRIKES